MEVLNPIPAEDSADTEEEKRQRMIRLLGAMQTLYFEAQQERVLHRLVLENKLDEINCSLQTVRDSVAIILERQAQFVELLLEVAKRTLPEPKPPNIRTITSVISGRAKQRVLEALQEFEHPCTEPEIARLKGMNQTTVRVALPRLEKRGLVRKVNDDPRMWVLCPTGGHYEDVVNGRNSVLATLDGMRTDNSLHHDVRNNGSHESEDARGGVAGFQHDES